MMRLNHVHSHLTRLWRVLLLAAVWMLMLQVTPATAATTVPAPGPYARPASAVPGYAGQSLTAAVTGLRARFPDAVLLSRASLQVPGSAGTVVSVQKLPSVAGLPTRVLIVTGKPRQVSVPKVTGQPWPQAARTLQAAGVSVASVRSTADCRARGSVPVVCSIREHRDAQHDFQGMAVIVSSTDHAAATVRVPDLAGMTLALADTVSMYSGLGGAGSLSSFPSQEYPMLPVVVAASSPDRKLVAGTFVMVNLRQVPYW